MTLSPERKDIGILCSSTWSRRIILSPSAPTLTETFSKSTPQAPKREKNLAKIYANFALWNTCFAYKRMQNVEI